MNLKVWGIFIREAQLRIVDHRGIKTGYPDSHYQNTVPDRRQI